MNLDKIKQFAEDENAKEAIRELIRRIDQLDTARDIASEADFMARQMAIDMVEGWIEEIFQVKRGDIEEIDEDDILKRYSEN